MSGVSLSVVCDIYLFISTYFHAVLLICVRPHSTIMSAWTTFFGGGSGSTFAADNLFGNGHFILSRV